MNISSLDGERAPLTWMGSQVQSLYRPPSFAYEASDGRYAEARQTKANELR
jgi:hypothetical protein